ncbi:MAG: hypothetical protein U1A77_04000 [Pirellulales bacterium]|jgi:hypothetical protein
MLKHLVLVAVVAVILSVCGSAEARLLGRRGGCPGGKCGLTTSAPTVVLTAAEAH